MNLLKVLVDFNSIDGTGRVPAVLAHGESARLGDIVVMEDPEAELTCLALVEDVDGRLVRLHPRENAGLIVGETKASGFRLIQGSGDAASFDLIVSDPRVATYSRSSPAAAMA